MEEDPEQTIKSVVKNVKSEGLFDQFRKECIEEFEKMDTYQSLKTKVEKQVSKFLSGFIHEKGLQKNQLRADLRQHITKSEFLINAVQDLVDEVLSIKGHGFCLKIDKEVDRYLNSAEKQTSKSEKNASAESFSQPLQDVSSLIENNDSSPSVVRNTESTETLSKTVTAEQYDAGSVSSHTENNAESNAEQIDNVSLTNHILIPELQAKNETIDEGVCNESIEVEQVDLNLNDKTDELVDVSNDVLNENKTDNSEEASSFVLSPTYDSVQFPENKQKCSPIEEEDNFSNISGDVEDIVDDLLDPQVKACENERTIQEACIENITDDEMPSSNTIDSPQLITEPISDESESERSSDSSHQSTYKSDNVSNPRRKSERVRKVPAKFRDSKFESGTRKSDDGFSSENTTSRRNENRKRGREKLKYTINKHLKRKRSRSVSSDNSTPPPRRHRDHKRHKHYNYKDHQRERNDHSLYEERKSSDSQQFSENVSSGKRMRRQRKVYSPS